MADVTGPISTLPNSHHKVPDGTMCDEHSDRPAVHRVQGETDSFGSEMNDMCQECYDSHKQYLCSDAAKENRIGTCEWCQQSATDLRDARDYDEGMSGRIYRVCGPCIKRVNDAAEEELSRYEDEDNDDSFYQNSFDGYEEA